MMLFVRPIVPLVFIVALPLAGCIVDNGTLALAYTDEDACVAAAVLTPPACSDAYVEALAAHDLSSPRYASLDACERAVGPGQCETAPSIGGAEQFRPVFYKFVTAESGVVAPQPLYPNARSNARLWTAMGISVEAKGDDVVLPPAALAAPQPQVYAAAAAIARAAPPPDDKPKKRKKQ